MKSQKQNLTQAAYNIRKSIIEMLVPKESHHIGCSLSIVEILTVLYFQILHVNPKKPQDPDRDIFILSKGHAAAALYATLAHRGFFPMQLLGKYDTDGGLLPEHATKVVPGIEVSTGSLGHGLPLGIGFVLGSNTHKKKNNVYPSYSGLQPEGAAKRIRGVYTDANSSKRSIYVLMSDGELNEGSNWEAIMFAGFHKLDNLVAIIDANGLQGYGPTKKVLDLGDIKDKIAPFGWNTYEVDGHNVQELATLFSRIKQKRNGKPHFVIARTIKGKGIPPFEGKFESHYYSISNEMKEDILRKM